MFGKKTGRCRCIERSKVDMCGTQKHMVDFPHGCHGFKVFLSSSTEIGLEGWQRVQIGSGQETRLEIQINRQEPGTRICTTEYRKKKTQAGRNEPTAKKCGDLSNTISVKKYMTKSIYISYYLSLTFVFNTIFLLKVIDHFLLPLIKNPCRFVLSTNSSKADTVCTLLSSFFFNPFALQYQIVFVLSSDCPCSKSTISLLTR